MPVDVATVLRKALSELESQKSRLDRQIAALHAALDGDAPRDSANEQHADFVFSPQASHDCRSTPSRPPADEGVLGEETRSGYEGESTHELREENEETVT
jgi:hypothetical protein